MVVEKISLFFQGIFNSIPEGYRTLVSLLFFTIFIAIYAVFIWKFYKFLARKEIVQLNLRQYNRSQHPGLEKFLAIVLYTVEYMVILPFLVLFWFTIFSLFLLLLSKSQNAHQILLISAAIIASTRIASYISEDLSKDLAKIFPFTVLALFLQDPNFFNLNDVFGKMVQITALFDNILIFIIFIFGIEFALRVIYSLAELLYSNEEKPPVRDDGKED